MTRFLGNAIGIEICEVFNLDPKNIAKLDILLHADDVARIEITRYLESQEIQAITGVLEKYEITAVKEKE